MAGHEWLLVATLGIAILLGGGGVDEALCNLAVQCWALVALFVCRGQVQRFVHTAPRSLLILTIATFALPIVQLLAHPPAIWTALPGRDLVRESLALVGQDRALRPLSVFPQRTLLAALALVPPALVLSLTVTLPSDRRWIPVLAIVALGLVNVAIGALQLASGGQVATLYPGGVPDQLYGTFANHNSAGIFLVGALCLLIVIPRRLLGSAPLQGARLAAGLIMLVSAVLTQSRSTMILLAVPAILLGYMVWRNRRGTEETTRPTIVRHLPALAAILLIGGASAIAGSAKVQQSLAQFDDLQDARTGIWDDAMGSAQRFWPVGSGMGTFDEVFQLDESLENVTRGRARRAHNDYLELAVEAGVPGLVLLFGWMAYLLFAVGRISTEDRPAQLGGFAAIVTIALQSFVDYPLRNLAMLCIFACLIGIISPTRKIAGATP